MFVAGSDRNCLPDMERSVTVTKTGPSGKGLPGSDFYCYWGNASEELAAPVEAKILTQEILTRFWKYPQKEPPLSEVAIRFMEWSTQVSKWSTVPSPSRKERLTGPVQFVNRLLETWNLKTEDAAPLLGLEPAEMPYVSDLLNGRTALRGRDVKDRIAYLFRIRKTLSALFPSEENENKWLRKPHPALEGEAPIQRLLEGSMENLLLVKEYVEVTAGR